MLRTVSYILFVEFKYFKIEFGCKLQMISYGKIYAPKNFAVALMYAGHLHKKCPAVSSAPHKKV